MFNKILSHLFGNIVHFSTQSIIVDRHFETLVKSLDIDLQFGADIISEIYLYHDTGIREMT